MSNGSAEVLAANLTFHPGSCGELRAFCCSAARFSEASQACLESSPPIHPEFTLHPSWTPRFFSFFQASCGPQRGCESMSG